MSVFRKQKENLEKQMQEALQLAVAILKKSEKAFDDTKVRKDFVGSSIEDQLTNAYNSIRAAHTNIVTESSIK